MLSIGVTEGAHGLLMCIRAARFNVTSICKKLSFCVSRDSHELIVIASCVLVGLENK
jgi:hypothetical protein